MLAQRAEHAATAAEDLRRVAALGSELEGLTTRAAALETAGKRLTSAAGTATALRAWGVPVPLDAGRLRALRLRVRAVATEFEGDPSSITRPEEARPTLWDELPAVATAAETALREAWQRYVDTRAQTESAPWLDTLANVPQLRSAIEQFRQIQSAIQQERAKLPTLPADVARLDRYVERLQETWRAIREQLQDPEGAGVSEDVIGFLQRAMSADGARLTDLTPAVLRWLSGHGAVPSVRIYLGAAGGRR
jgi:hypothetical protein